MVPIAVAAYLVANVLAVPMWLRLSQRWGKLKAFKRSMIFNALAYLPLGLAVYQPLIDATTDLQRLGLACLAAMCIGVGANARNNLGESVAGDIIDDDHARTGERKEGVFFSFWMLAQKTAGGGVTLFSAASQYGNELSVSTAASLMHSSCSSDANRSLFASRFPMINSTRSGYSSLSASSSLVKRMSPGPLSCESPPNTNIASSRLNLSLLFAPSSHSKISDRAT